MRNLQKSLNIIWQLPISWQRPPRPPFSSKNLQTTSFPPILDKLSTRTVWTIWGGFTLCMVLIGTLPHLLLPLLKKKKLYGTYYIDNTRRKFSFYQKKVPMTSSYSFGRSPKIEKLSRPWRHLVFFNQCSSTLDTWIHCSNY